MAVHDLGEGVRLWTRDEWGAEEDLRPMTRHDLLREVFLHHTANVSVEGINTLEEQKRAVRAMQDYHRFVQGWADIGYAFVVFQPYGGLTNARVFQGRETKWVPAAQALHNTGTVPICVSGNFQADDGVKPETITAIVRTIRWVDRHHADSLRTVGGHRDVVATTCPGNTLYSKIPEIARRADLRRY